MMFDGVMEEGVTIWPCGVWVPVLPTTDNYLGG